MTIDYSWEWLQWQSFMPSLYFLFCYAGFMLYAKGKRKNVKEKAVAYGKYFLIISIMCLLAVFMWGIEILNPLQILLIGLSLLALILVYLDGWLTNKAVGRDLAVEANIMMEWLFGKIGIKSTRIFIFVVIAGLISYWLFSKETVALAIICAFWLLVDGSNIVVWRQIKICQRLKASVVADELGSEDIHEL